mmetsp:Transcript_87825/g.131697  ORF Transcript_87825/g.131697 Transcript_87825/m.131697 type:complete len:435 (+) Transcript_87825:253-1557(+)
MSTVLTSTTAPGKEFASRAELAEHYKSDWHKYNLKRREAGLPLLEETDFQARWEAALALRKDKEAKQHAGTDHLKNSKKNKKKTKQLQLLKQRPKAEGPNGDTDGTDFPTSPSALPEGAKQLKPELAESQENPDINPNQCLFDSHVSDSLEHNIEYMHNNYGFFIPDRECLHDLEGFLGYCHEKIKLGHYCLYCEKMFPTWQGCQKHMISKQHTKLKYEEGFWDELDPFYDFDRDSALIPGSQNGPIEVRDSIDGEEEDGWEDMSESDDVGMDLAQQRKADEDVYAEYEKEIARFGLDVTPLGELVFPDGRIVGHRALQKYYKQRARPVASSTAIIAAKRAAGERVYQGSVVNIGSPSNGKMKGSGSGILVPLEDGVKGFSALSLYRFRAAVKKQRRDDEAGHRLKQRTSQNVNRMDKKANRLMNNVSVAHNPR